MEVTKRRSRSVIYWKGLSKDVRNFVRTCAVCQRNKPDLVAPVGLLQPLPIPIVVWKEISMDFIEGLPKSRGKDTILVVVDKLSKYAGHYFGGGGQAQQICPFLGLVTPFPSCYGSSVIL